MRSVNSPEALLHKLGASALVAMKDGTLPQPEGLETVPG
jgi:hypothetical protein